MTIQLRQICLVARELRPVIDDLTNVLGIHACFVDPGCRCFWSREHLDVCWSQLS